MSQITMKMKGVINTIVSPSEGGLVVRKKRSIKTKEDYKSEYKATIKLLRQGFSVRKTAVLSGTSVSSVQRIKKMFNL